MSPTGGKKEFSKLIAVRLKKATLEYYKGIADENGISLSDAIRLVLEAFRRKNEHIKILVADFVPPSEIRPVQSQARSRKKRK